MFWTYEIPLFRLLVTKRFLVNFFWVLLLDYSVSYQSAPIVAAVLAIYCWSHPILPLKGQSHALIMEYLVKNSFMTATVKSTWKKKSTQLHILFAFDSDIFCVFHTSGQGHWSLGKKHANVNTTITSVLSHLFSISLLFCKTDFWKQILEAGGKKWWPMGSVHCEKRCLGFL